MEASGRGVKKISLDGKDISLEHNYYAGIFCKSSDSTDCIGIIYAGINIDKLIKSLEDVLDNVRKNKSLIDEITIEDIIASLPKEIYYVYVITGEKEIIVRQLEKLTDILLKNFYKTKN